jgi:hypothetical protein
MKIKRNHFALMSAFGALASAGAAAVEFVKDKLHRLHVETEQHCQFDDQAALEDFLANIPDPQNWVDPLTKPALLGETRVEVDLGQLRAALNADAAPAEQGAVAPVIDQAAALNPAPAADPQPELIANATAPAPDAEPAATEQPTETPAAE